MLYDNQMKVLANMGYSDSEIAGMTYENYKRIISIEKLLNKRDLGMSRGKYLKRKRKTSNR